MQSTKQWLEQANQVCGEIGPDDGIDPRYLHEGHGRKSVSYKTMQLCKEAGKVLSMIFNGELGEPILNELQVIRTDSEGEGQFIRVTLGHIDPELVLDEGEVMSALSRVKGYLRTAIAQQINRKRMPALKFKYAGLIEQGD